MVCLHRRHNGYMLGLIYSYRREVRSCSFRQVRQFSGALSSEASDGWASRFLFICVLFSFFNFDAVAPSLFWNIIMDKMELEKNEVKYQAPLVEVIEVQVEKGFASSSDSDGVLGDYENGGVI